MTLFYVLYSDKTWFFDQSECAQSPIYIIKNYTQVSTVKFYLETKYKNK